MVALNNTMLCNATTFMILTKRTFPGMTLGNVFDWSITEKEMKYNGEKEQFGMAWIKVGHWKCSSLTFHKGEM